MATISNTFASTASLISSLSNVDLQLSSLNELDTIFSYTWTYKENSAKTQITGTNSSNDLLVMSGVFSQTPYSINSLTYSGSDGTSLSVSSKLSLSSSGDISGYLSSFDYSDSSTSFKLTGKIYPSGDSISTLSYLEIQSGSYKFSLAGTFKFNSDFDLTSASLTAFSYTDGSNKFMVSDLANIDVMSIFNSEADLAESDVKTFLSGADTITGDSKENYLAGFGGADSLTGLEGNDTLDGGAGNDTLNGGNGSDRYLITALTGGDDTVTDTGGTDDALVWNSGTSSNTYIDVSRGGLSTTNANLIVKVYQDGVLKQTNTVVNQFSNTASTATTISGTAPTSAIEGVYIADDDQYLKIVNSLTGTSADELIVGTAGANTLRGNAGIDFMFGGAGNDTLNGGEGADQLDGGAGNDIFIFNTSTASNVDKIVDFTTGSDKIQLSKSIFANAGATGNLTNNAFWSAAGAVKGHDADDRVIYNETSGALYYDADGNGSGVAVQIALLGTSSHPTIAYTDFAVIA
jgi:Ca2+-binding RTX toxin-like protein